MGTDQDNNKENFCSVCGRSESVVGQLLQLPYNMHVCKDCMQQSMDTMKNMGNFQEVLKPFFAGNVPIVNDEHTKVTENKETAESPESSDNPGEGDENQDSSNLKNVSIFSLGEIPGGIFGGLGR